jgi:hypothetical protein
VLLGWLLSEQVLRAWLAGATTAALFALVTLKPLF